MDEYILDTSDRLSPLPDFIVHHILSFLDSYTDLVRTSVLSKRWFTLWATFPILDFDISKMVEALKVIKCRKLGIPTHTRDIDLDLWNPARDKLIKYAAYTLSKFSEHNVIAYEFKLNIQVEEPIETTSFDKLISLVLEKDVRVFGIRVQARSGRNKYRLPETLLFAKSLISLALCECELPSSLLVYGMKFKSLKSLSLCWVHIDDQVMKCLTTMCPLLEELKVLNCEGLEVFCVSSLQNLQRVDVSLLNKDETVYIEAPNLTYFSIDNASEITMRHINLFSCKNLKSLCLFGLQVGTTWFSELIPSFPLLENVSVDYCGLEKIFMVSSHSLREFELGYCNEMKEIRIDAPSLLLFRYTGDANQPLVSLTSDFAKWEARIDTFDLKDEDGMLWFHRLRQFLCKQNKFKVLYLDIQIDMDSSNVDDLKTAITPPYQLEHLELTILRLSSAFRVVDAVFWCCHPQSLTILVDTDLLCFEKKNEYVKYIYEKLLHQVEEFEKEIVIVIAGGSKTENGFISLDSLLDALPRLQEGQQIIFRTKKLYARSNALKR